MVTNKYLPDSFEWQCYLIFKNIQINIVIGGYTLSFSKIGIHNIVLASQIFYDCFHYNARVAWLQQRWYYLQSLNYQLHDLL